MKKWAKQNGFTIVELLIVVVVIAILAAITVIAFNGIQNRAKGSALATTVASTGKKVALYAVDNADMFPDESSYQSALNLPASTPTATYDYYTSNDRKSYCLSLTNTTTTPETSYAVTSKSGGSVPGRCIENLVVNPSFSTGGSGWTVFPSLAASYPTNGSPCGSTYRRATATSAIANGTWVAQFQYGSQLAVSTGQTYTLSAQMRRSVGTQASLSLDWRASGGSSLGVGSSALTIVGSTNWTLISSTAVAPANATNVQLSLIYNGGAALNEALDAACVMVTQSNKTYTYGDGDTANWSWVGTPGASASFGPAQAN